MVAPSITIRICHWIEDWASSWRWRSVVSPDERRHTSVECELRRMDHFEYEKADGKTIYPSIALPETIGITRFEIFTAKNFESIDEYSSTRSELTFHVEHLFFRMIIRSTIDSTEIRMIDVIHLILFVKFLLRGKATSLLLFRTTVFTW